MKDNRSNSQLVLENVSHSFGELHVIKDLNITVEQGELVVLVGPSGCGKTTLLNLLSGHIKPISGNVKREGIIRTVYQQDGLFPWLTVSENILMGLRSISDTAIQEQELREGMRQRVELARAIAGDSDILLMDEPFSALDYQTRLRLRRELLRLLAKRPRTVVFVTHDIEEAVQLADRILILSKRPAYVCSELQIEAQHPRSLDNPSVITAMKTILDELGLHTSSDLDVSEFNNLTTQ